MTRVASGMTIPNPVRKAVLSTRNGSDDRLVKINRKIRVDMVRQRNCQANGEILLLLFEVIAVNYKVIPVISGSSFAPTQTNQVMENFVETIFQS